MALGELRERFDGQALIDRVDDWIVGRPGTLLLVALLVTGVFGLGLSAVSTESGTSQFTEDTPAQAAFEDVNREFSEPFAADTGTTQLIQTRQNVLGRRGLLEMLSLQRELADRPALRVAATSSAARIVARELDPNATTLAAQERAIERATPSEVDAAVRDATDESGFRSQLSTDFNRRSASASATIGVVTHELPAGLDAGAAGASAESPLTSIQQRVQYVTRSLTGTTGDVRVFGAGLVSAEFGSVIFDSLLIVVPAAVLLILFFLILAYRDPLDLLLGVVALATTLIWTIGFLGLVGIPFNQILIAVPPLLLAVGIDFGIHAINRYREERVEGSPVAPAMRRATDQLLVAFALVTGTTVIGFAANLTSSLGPIRDFGLVAAVGIVFTFVIFGVVFPAGKVFVDRRRERLGIPALGRQPLGRSGTLLGSVLPVGIGIARRAPYVFLALVLVVTAGAGVYGLGVDTTFSDEDFLPPEDTPAFLDDLPEPFAPGTYTVTGTLNFLEDNFEAAQGDTVTVFVEAPMRRDAALEALQRASRDPPETFVASERRAERESIVTVIGAYADASPEFARLVRRNDADGDGVPDDSLARIYDELFASSFGDRASRYLTEDRRNARVVYTIEGDADQQAVTADAREVASRFRYEATATGETVVFQAIADTILGSAIRSLGAALAFTAVFLVIFYWFLTGRASLGVVNLVPVVVTVALIAGSMRALGVPFNALTATILSITIGLGVDYSAHLVHRFADEYAARGLYPALDEAVRGTGGALTASMLTTTTGIGVLVLAITPVLGQFGIITGLSIFYSYLTAVVITPSAVVVWQRATGA